MRSISFNSMYATSFRELEAHAFRNRIHSNSLLLRIDNRLPAEPSSDRMTFVKEAMEAHRRGVSTCSFGLEDLANANIASRKEVSCADVRFARHSSNCTASRTR